MKRERRCAQDFTMDPELGPKEEPRPSPATSKLMAEIDQAIRQVRGAPLPPPTPWGDSPWRALAAVERPPVE